MDKPRGIWRGVFWVALLLGLTAGIAGCTRSFYRRSADREVNDILAEKDKYPQWKVEQWHVYPDARARFADTSNPDRPPMPPDDEAAWTMSPHPQKPSHHKGVVDEWGTGYLEMIKAWDAENLAEREAAGVGELKVTGPAGASKTPVKAYMDEPLRAERRGFLLKMDQAIELGVVNSPAYQNFREQLYLAALPVTQQRYGFAYQWAATADWIREWAGPKSAKGRVNSWTGTSTIGFNKLFATGALLTADFVNTTAFNFVGNGFTSSSTINLNLAQPLLQGGGKAVTLEPLTQAERNLFYEMRGYARFREQFNVAIAIGASLPGSLQAASGTGGGGTGPISALAALGIASTDVAGGFVGYLSVLFRECDMAADQKWHYDLQSFFKVLEAYQEGGFYSPLQVDQARSTMLQAENTVLADQQFVANGLDQFKLLLGLPANTPLILDDAPARPITQQYDRYYEVIDDAGVVSRRVELYEKVKLLDAKTMRSRLLELFTSEDKMTFKIAAKGATEKDKTVTITTAEDHEFVKGDQVHIAGVDAPGYNGVFTILKVDHAKKQFTYYVGAAPLPDSGNGTASASISPVIRGTEFRKKVGKAWDEWKKEKSLEKLMEKYIEERIKLLDRKTQLELAGKTLPADDERKLIEVGFKIDLGNLERELRKYDAQPWVIPEKEKEKEKDKVKPKDKDKDKEVEEAVRKAKALRNQIELASLVVQKAKQMLVHARNERFDETGLHWPEAPPTLLGDLDLVTTDVDKAQEAAVQAALTNRLDLMNARAQVVDAWRQLAVTANALLGVTTVQYNLLTQTPPIGAGVRPLAFAASATDQQLRLDFQLPLNRLAQRNAYRTAQINYQVARRSLMTLEDSIAAQVRFDVRQLQLFTANYRIQKRIIHSFYKQVESALDVIVSPTDPDALKGSGTSVQANAAALTSQYLGALGGLNNAQTKMYDIWLSLYATRMQLYLDLDRLPLDMRGVWVDELANVPQGGAADGKAAANSGEAQAPSNRDVNREGMAPANATVIPAAVLGPPHFLPPYEEPGR
jgi:hypothetical protein